MGIKQLNGTYVGAEDRILLRVTTDAAEEVRLWLTRAVTLQLLVAIRGSAARAIAQKFPPQVAQTVAEFEQQSIRAQTRLDDQFQSGATFPLGDAPALVVKLEAALKADDLSLDLTLSQGNKVNLCLPRHLAQQFGVLLDRIQGNAGWGAPAVAPATTAGAAAPPETKVVH
jgi:hypothetical protein